MRNKRKGILMASAILGSAAIVSTGFAAWVITAPQQQTAVGNIQVDNVRDDRLTITPTWDSTSNGSVYFGAPATMDIQGAWLRNDSVGKPEVMDLDLTLNFKYNDTDNGKTTDDINGTVAVSIAVNDGKTIDASLIELPKFATSYEVVKGKVNIPVSFKWGTYFGSTGGVTTDTNPYNFYNDGNHGANDRVEPNSETNKDTWADDALSKLTTIHGYNGHTFTITVDFTWAD